jgi:hypothetical protein
MQLQGTSKLQGNKFSDVKVFEAAISLLHKHFMKLNVSHFLSSETYSKSSA